MTPNQIINSHILEFDETRNKCRSLVNITTSYFFHLLYSYSFLQKKKILYGVNVASDDPVVTNIQIFENRSYSEFLQ